MQKHKHGEYIHLHWDDYGFHPYYIKGHVSEAEAHEVMQSEQDFTPDRINYRYARCVKIGPEHEESFDGIESTFRVINEPRVSYYPVTECFKKEYNGRN